MSLSFRLYKYGDHIIWKESDHYDKTKYLNALKAKNSLLFLNIQLIDHYPGFKEFCDSTETSYALFLILEKSVEREKDAQQIFPEP